MPNYQQGKIYTIRCRTDDTLIYVGSTTQNLAVRWGGHKRDSINEQNKNRLIYQTINNNWDNWFIEIFELYPCSCKEELNKREGEVIRLIGNLNVRIAGRTQKEWIENNAEKVKEQQKEYYINHADDLKEQRKERYKNHADKLKNKITCECGCLISMVVLTRHRKTQKHIDLMLKHTN